MSALWLTEAQADTYFATRFGASDHWVSGVDKLAALTTAQSQIENSDKLPYLPTTAVQVMKDAVCEQALFLVIHGADSLGRGGLIAQGVTKAGIVHETYDPAFRGSIPLAATALGLLTDYGNRSFRISELERDEEEELE